MSGFWLQNDTRLSEKLDADSAIILADYQRRDVSRRQIDEARSVIGYALA